MAKMEGVAYSVVFDIPAQLVTYSCRLNAAEARSATCRQTIEPLPVKNNRLPVGNKLQVIRVCIFISLLSLGLVHYYSSSAGETPSLGGLRKIGMAY